MSNWDDPNSPSSKNAGQSGGSNFFGDLADPFAEPAASEDNRTADLFPAPAAAPPTPPPAESAEEEAAGPVQRDAAHLERLENEWRRLQRAFAYHPHVRVMALEGDPPDQYQIDYRFRTVLMDENGQLQYSTTCSVHIWLPPGFPHEPPLVRPVSDLFHPNIVPEGVNIDRCWTSTRSTLVDVIAGVGAMLCYQDFDLANPWNPAAAEWTHANPRILPLDPDANLRPEAGGDPLQRICRHGPRTLEQTRQQLKQMCDSLLITGQAPDDQEVRSFAEKTRQSLSLFIEDDIPEELRVTVGDLDDFAGALPAAVPCWEGLRRYRDNAAAATQTARKLRDAEKSMEIENRAIDGLVTQAPPSDPHEAMRILPRGETLDAHQQNLEGLIARTDQVVGDARTTSSRIEALPELAITTHSSVLQKRLDAEIERARATVNEAREKLNEAMASIEPVLARSRAYAQVVRRMIEWRSYADMVDRAEEFSHEVLSLGPAGTQAFFIENESGRFGPFEIEQKLTLGSAALIVRNPSSTSIELIAADTGKTLVKSDEGKAAMPITDPQSGAIFRTRFQLSGNCDELAVQFDYAARESTMLLEKLRAGVRSPKDCWLGAFNDLFSAPAKHKQIREEHDRFVRRWETLRDDLRSLRPFKERLATFRLIQHMHDWVGQLVEKSRNGRKTEKETTERISQIVSGCNTEIETGRLLIPQKFSKEYPELLDKRDRVRHELSQLGDQARRAIAAIQARVNNAGLRGAADLPQLLLLGALPEAWPTLVSHMSDKEIGGRLAELEGPLKTKLQPDGWPGGPEPARPEAQAPAKPAERPGNPGVRAKGQLPPAPPVVGDAVDGLAD